MAKKLKGVRTLDQINMEYSSVCGLLGDRRFRVKQLIIEGDKLENRLHELDIEAGAAKKQMDALAAKGATPVPDNTDKDGTA